MKKIAMIVLIIMVGCFASAEWSYSESGQIDHAQSIKSETRGQMLSEDIFSPSYKTEEWLFAHETTSSTKKKREFNVFGKPQSVVDNRAQTKEWEARTLRSLGLLEFFGGIGLAITGIVIMDDSAPGGLASIAAGIGAAYIGYKDLKASKRFFYPNSLYSRKDIREDHMYGHDNTYKNKKDFAIQVNLVSTGF